MMESSVRATTLERRSGGDRRRPTLQAVWCTVKHPRRRSGRRWNDADQEFILDWHSPRLFLLALLILGLCVLDGVFTVLLIRGGATELNPVLAPFLPDQLGWFAAIKLGLTAIGLLVLVVYSRMKLFRRVQGEVFLYFVAVSYAALIVYQLYLLDRAPSVGAWV